MCDIPPELICRQKGNFPTYFCNLTLRVTILSITCCYKTPEPRFNLLAIVEMGEICMLSSGYGKGGIQRQTLNSSNDCFVHFLAVIVKKRENLCT